MGGFYLTRAVQFGFFAGSLPLPPYGGLPSLEVFRLAILSFHFDWRTGEPVMTIGNVGVMISGARYPAGSFCCNEKLTEEALGGYRARKIVGRRHSV
jgi:hypothetical protein